MIALLKTNRVENLQKATLSNLDSDDHDGDIKEIVDR
jgi:hypothetical protein